MNETSNDNTRERILDDAERLFAEKGFAAVSIREITSAAKSNLAAVNYYFGNKHNLYLTIFRERWIKRAKRVRQCFTQALADHPESEISDVITAMANSFLEGPLSEEERRNHIQLFQRELMDPGEALNMVVGEVIGPYIRELTGLIRKNTGKTVSNERMKLTVLSILGIILYFSFSRPVVSQVMGREYDESFKSDLISHITAFALNGINPLVRKP